MKRLYKSILAIMVVTSTLCGAVGPVYAAPMPVTVVEGMSLSSKCMLGLTAFTAAVGFARYWWVSGTAERIAQAQALTTQQKWVHNFKALENPQENAKKLIQHFNEARNGIAVLTDSGSERHLSSVNIEELMSALNMHQRALEVRVREIEKVVGDERLSAEGKTVQNRKDRVQQIIDEENVEHRSWQPWLKEQAERWFKKPNRNAALACLKKMYGKITDLENLAGEVQELRSQYFNNSESYRATARLLATVKQQKEAVDQDAETSKKILKDSLANIKQVCGQDVAISNKIKNIENILDSTSKIDRILSNVATSLNDLLMTIQNQILDEQTGRRASNIVSSRDTRTQEQSQDKDSGNRESKRELSQSDFQQSRPNGAEHRVKSYGSFDTYQRDNSGLE